MSDPSAAPLPPRHRVLVTGATGFVGSAVVRALAAAGHTPVAFRREGTDPVALAGLTVAMAVGDMLDPGSLDRALDGCDALIHVAADYRLWAPNPREIVDNNRRGTAIVMDAARRAGLRRIVYTSSVAVLRARTDGVAVDETQPLAPDEAIGAYKLSKVLAESEVLRRIADGLPAVVVNPSTPIGPRDVKPTPTGRVVLDAASGRIPAFVDTGLNLVHVDDVARGHVLALERGRVGERYILGGADVPLARMLADIAEIVGRPAPTVRLPRLPLMPLALGAELWGRLSGREPLLTVDALKMARYRMYFSSAKATAELGYGARPYREALVDAIAWFRDHGRLA